MAYIDEYLLSEFSWLASDNNPNVRRYERPPTLQMLMQVKNEEWTPDSRDYVEHFRIGRIIAFAGSRRTLDYLRDNQQVLAIEASRDLAQPIYPSPGAGNSNGIVVPVAPDPTEKGDSVIIGIMDTGIDITHEAFLDHGSSSRIIGIWDTRDSNAPHPPGLPFGKYYDKNEIDRLIQNPNLIPPELQFNYEHGTHVASIAAGCKAGTFNGGIAPAAKIVVVIPTLAANSANPRSLGYSNSALAGLKFIQWLSSIYSLPSVVNISLGCNAGGHDGTTLLEEAVDNITGNGNCPGFLVVKSAGNERNLNHHVRMSLDYDKEIQWVSSLDNNAKRKHYTEDYVEFWFNPRNNLEFQLNSINSQSQWVGNSNMPAPVIGWVATCIEYEMWFTSNYRNNGDSRLMIRIRYIHHCPLCCYQEWALKIKINSPNPQDVIDGWIESRDNRSAKFLTPDENCTLTIPGTTSSIITVGAIDPQTNQMTDFSSYGPTRVSSGKPDISAPGLKITAAAAGTTNGATDMNGTSMAAPHVTGAIALLLSNNQKAYGKGLTPNLLTTNDILQKLIRTAMPFSGMSNRNMGVGILDINKFLK